MAQEATVTDNPGGKADAPATDSLDLKSSMEKAYDETVGAKETPQAEKPEVPPVEVEKLDQPADLYASFDPDKLPPEALNKLFEKFQPKLSERAQAFKIEKEALADRIVAAWERQNGGQPAPPTIEQQIKEAIDSGNLEQAVQLANAPLNERLSRIEMADAQKRAYDSALSVDPTISENDAEIASRLSSDPNLARLAAANGFAAAPLVLRGINAVIQNEKLQKELTTVKGSIEAQVKAGVEKYIAERKALINQTGTGLTQAGKILNPDTDRKMSLKESMEAAWAENAT